MQSRGAHGPFEPGRGMRFDPTNVLLDPYGRGVVVPKDDSRVAASNEVGNLVTARARIHPPISGASANRRRALRRREGRIDVH